MSHGDRLHSLDAVRAFALLAGVVLHATMSFLPGFGALGWPIADSSPSVTLGVTFYVIHIFRMTLFFLVAGFFGRLLLQRDGVRGFVRNRAKRILAPLVVGWIVVFPLIVGALAWGASKASGSARPPQLPDDPLWFPLTHLWFLYVLLWLYAATLLVRAAVGRVVAQRAAPWSWIDRAVAGLVHRPVAPVLLGAPLWFALIGNPTWSAWVGVPTPDQSLVPNAAAAIGFGTAFGFGWLLHRQPDLLRVWEARWLRHAVGAVALTVVCLTLLGVSPDFAPTPRGWRTWLYAACYTTAVWMWTFALIGGALRFFWRASPVRRYIADASYWIYLMHLPVVFFLQVAVQDRPWHWSLKFPLIVTTALGLLFASYHGLVRPTWIGEVLNGRRYPRRASKAAPAPAAAATHPTNSPLAELRSVRKRYAKTVALDGLDLQIRPGEILALLGPNGAGKTTAISLLLGLKRPDAGEAWLFGRPPQELEARQQIGVMMQEVTLPAELRVRELIDLVTAHYPAPYGVEEALALTGTTPLANRLYGKLSAGQKRQVQFAIAVCGRPRLLFLDEPTVGLDIEARTMLWRTIRQLVDAGTSIVLTTHYLEEAETLADRVAVLARGRLIASGTVDEIRGAVMRKRISCRTVLEVDHIAAWPGVVSASSENGRVEFLATDADAAIRRLITADAGVHELEVVRAGLAEAFTELTKEAA